MKIITLYNNQWKEKINPNITLEENIILNDKNTTLETITALQELIIERSFQPISSEEYLQVENIYNQNKIEDATLIDVNINLPKERGIINCRLSGEHKQIRF